MKLRLKNTPEQVELIKAMGSKDRNVSAEAASAFAAFAGPVVSQVLNQAGSANAIYTPLEYKIDEVPSIPVDLWYDEGEGYTTIWSQTMAGGLPTNQVDGGKELKFHTFTLDSAVAYGKKFARQCRLDVVSKALTRLAGEVLVKQERNGWAVILRAVAEAGTNGLSHVIAATTASTFQVDDLNRLMTRIDRINTSFANGTPSDFDYKGLTDLWMSPEMVEQVRAFAYQPMNTRAVPNTDESTVLALPDSVRTEIYKNAGASEIYGVGIHKLIELGSSKKYNTLFKSFYTGTFSDSADECIIGLDLSREAFVRPIMTDEGAGGSFNIVPDDQFVARQDKIGFYGELEQGNICLDGRAAVALTV